MLFESELEFALEDGKTNVGYEYADFSYIFNEYVILRAGKFLLPFGTFMERLHPSWVNRLDSKPLAFVEDAAIAPASGIGAELRGSFAVGGGKVNYSVYTTNGPTLKDGSEVSEEAGMLSFKNFDDNNNNKAVGGRLGILPLSNSSVEIGISGYSGVVGSKGDSLYDKIGAFLYAVDFSFVRQIRPLKGTVDIKAQYNASKVDKATYYKRDESGVIDPASAYTFDNSVDGYYAQLSYRPSMLKSDFFKDFEAIGRFSAVNLPEGSLWARESTQFAFGLNYWLSWRSVFKFTYQKTVNKGEQFANGESTTTEIFLHWALGF